MQSMAGARVGLLRRGCWATSSPGQVYENAKWCNPSCAWAEEVGGVSLRYIPHDTTQHCVIYRIEL